MLASLVETFCMHLEAEGCTPKTIENQRASLKKFAAWLEANNETENPTEWTATTIRSYFVALKHMKKPNGEPLSLTSVSTYAKALRTFCRWLKAEEFTDKNPMERVKPPAAPKLVKPVLSADDCRAVLNAAKSTRNGVRDEAILLFMMDTGARANEVCGMALADVNWKQRIAKVYGKGQKERYLPFSAATAVAMQRYSVRVRTAACDSFFQSEEGRPLTTSGLLQLCQRIGERAGVDLHPHKLRHTFAISYLRSGATVFALQKTLGHSSLDMSLRYSALMTEDLVKDHAKHSPVASLLSKRA